VLVIEHGRLAERGSVAELKQRGGALQMMLAAGG
jgi:ABC-type multidrug transport system fused ATPase/permease subunit